MGAMHEIWVFICAFYFSIIVYGAFPLWFIWVFFGFWSVGNGICDRYDALTLCHFSFDSLRLGFCPGTLSFVVVYCVCVCVRFTFYPYLFPSDFCT